MRQLDRGRRHAATAALVLWIAAFPSQAAARDSGLEASRSRFAALWTGETAWSEPGLLALAKDADPVARQYAALRLAEIDPPSDAALTALVQALGDRAEEVRFQALAGLLRLGRPATPLLAEMLLDLQPIAEAGPPSRPVSRSDLAFTALTNAREVDVDTLLRTYRSAPPEAEETEDRPASPRRRIRMVLERRTPAKVTPGLLDALQSGDVALRVTVANMMGWAGDDAAVAVPALSRAVAEDGASPVRGAAAFALARIPEIGPQALRGLLRHTNPQTRGFALAAYPADAGDSAELVAALLKDPESEVRRAALDRIGHYSALSRGLPDSILPVVMELARDADARTRAAAVEALDSFGYARPTLAPAVADALLVTLSDPVDEVASSAADALAGLAERKVVPRSRDAVDRLIAGLADPARREEHGEMLTVLEHMDLPAARRVDLIHALLNDCLAATGLWHCQQVKAILGARPGWLEAAVEALVGRHPDVRTYDDRALSALAALDSAGSVYARELERLLEHPKKSLRVRAAVALAERGTTPTRVWQVLEEGARSPDDDRRWREGDSERALAGFGEQGIARLIAILRDPATEKQVRIALISHTFSRVAAKSSQAADAILAAAADPTDPEVQKSAIQALDSIASRADEVRIVLEKAFLTGNAGVRRAVVSAWEESGLPPGDLVERAFADADPGVREAAFEWLPLLPKDDPRPIQLTAAALRDENERVRDKGLWFAGELSEPGADLLAQYVARGGPLSQSFFSGVAQLDSFGDALVPALKARAAGESTEVRNRILDMLGDNGDDGSEAPWDLEHMYVQLEAPGAADREYAARALLALREDPWARGGLLAAVLMEAEVRNIIRWRLRAALYRLSPEPAPAAAEAASGPRRLPQFPWPPPPGYSRVVVPRELLAASATTTFGAVYRRLVGAIEAASDGFEHGLFSGPTDGFTLVARMERIERDGTPLPEPARWVKEGSPKLSLVDLLADLFFERPGYFRVIVFAVTGDLVPGQNPDARLPEPEEGAPGMPDELARKPFGNKEVLALIYSFERRHDARITPWKDGAPSARQHLERAGVWTRLGTASPHR